MNQNVWVIALAASISFGTPIILAALGEILAERSGVLNLGVEGMMLLGACVAFLAGDAWGNVWLAILCGVVAGGALAAIHAFLCVSLRANQIVSGLALVLFGTGLARYLGQPVEGEARAVRIESISVPGLSRLPVIGPLLFEQDIIVYCAWALVLVTAVYLTRTRAGLALRATGESPATADSQGISVSRIRYAHVVIGGLFAGLGGAYQALARAPSWNQEATTNGIGWIAIALVVFASWRPGRALAGAVIFGFAIRARFTMQAASVTFIPGVVLQMLPYLLTVIVLIALSWGDARRRVGAPAALGLPFVRDER